MLPKKAHALSHRFLAIRFSLMVEKVHRQLGQQDSCLYEDCYCQFRVEDSQNCCEYGMVISKNNPEVQQSHNVQEV